MKVLLVVSAMIGSYCACAQNSRGVEYVVTNKKFRNAGWLLAGGGSTLIAGGVILLSAKDRSSNRELKQAVGGGLVAAGAISLGSSIPMFVIGSQSNAVKFSLKKEKFLCPESMGGNVTMGYRNRTRPAVALQFDL